MIKHDDANSLANMDPSQALKRLAIKLLKQQKQIIPKTQASSQAPEYVEKRTLLVHYATPLHDLRGMPIHVRYVKHQA